MRNREREGLSVQNAAINIEYGVQKGKERHAGAGQSLEICCGGQKSLQEELRRKEARWGSGASGTAIPTVCKRKAVLECLKSIQAGVGGKQAASEGLLGLVHSPE